jgi:hypothetical protein
LAQRLAGKDLSALFTAWLFTPSRPDVGTAATARSAAATPPRSWAQIRQTRSALRH